MKMKLQINFKPNISLNGMISRAPKYTLATCVFILLIMISKSLWWVAKPSSINYLSSANTLQTNDLMAQQLINLAPFGTFKEEKPESKEAELPKDKITIYGVYASGPKNSIALAKINDKDAVIQIGDSFAGGTVSQILPNKIVVSINGIDISYIVSANPDAEQSEFANRTDSNTTTQDTQNNSTPNTNKEHSPDPEINNIAEQRRKMIQKFQENNDSNNSERSTNTKLNSSS
ncbi:MAG: hypothetical protein EKK64_02250 [Neisseriaceae bacterium]|nr:MAG: hypothetical protein EKK64_02250 [Neisseriaceae bacterium]